VKKVIETFESEDIQRALVGYDATFAETFLSLLPTKKALMIQNDLFHMTEFPPISQCADSRRRICQKIELEFELQRFSLEEHWKNMTGEQSESFQAGTESFEEQPTESERTSVMEQASPLQDELTSSGESPETKKPVVTDLIPEEDDDEKYNAA